MTSDHNSCSETTRQENKSSLKKKLLETCSGTADNTIATERAANKINQTSTVDKTLLNLKTVFPAHDFPPDELHNSFLKQTRPGAKNHLVNPKNKTRK